MSATPVKFYQVGSFAVGNRLLDPELRTRAGRAGPRQRADVRPPRLPGLRRGARRPVGRWTRPCAPRRPAGRGQRDRLPGGVLDALPRDVLAGAVAALAVRQRARGRHRRCGRRCRPRVATTCASSRRAVTAERSTSASRCLSGMFERNDDVLVRLLRQRGLHEHRGAALGRHAARRPDHDHAGRRRAHRQRFGQGKDVPRIAMAHEIPYVATATVADLRDLEARWTGDGHARCPLPARARAVPARLGPAAGDTMRSRGWPPRAGCSPCSRPSAARSRRSPDPAPVPVEEYLRSRTATRTCSRPCGATT